MDVIIIILVIILQYFKIKSRKDFFNNYIRTPITILDFIFSVCIIVFAIFTLYLWLLMHIIPKEGLRMVAMPLSLFLILTILFYLFKIIILFYSKIIIKKYIFYLSIIYEVGFCLFLIIDKLT